MDYEAFTTTSTTSTTAHGFDWDNGLGFNIFILRHPSLDYNVAISRHFPHSTNHKEPH